jgi:hypothetical protein
VAGLVVEEKIKVIKAKKVQEVTDVYTLEPF